jgi:hypothetical protein
MRSCVQRVIRLSVLLAASGGFAGCAQGSSTLTGADGGSSGADLTGNGGASSGAGGSSGSSSAQGGDAASSGGGALGSSGSSASGGAFEQGGSGGAAVGGSALGGGGGAAGTAGSAGSGGTAGGGTGGSGGGSGGRAGSGGGGAGGSSGTVHCSDHPLTAKSSWTITASNTDVGSPLVNIDDGDTGTRWSTGVSQNNDWLQVDFGTDVDLDTITLALGNSPADYPRAYQVRLSELTHNSAATALASGSGQQGVDTVVTLAKPAVGRYLLISQVGSVDGTWWSVAELKLACTH